MFVNLEQVGMRMAMLNNFAKLNAVLPIAYRVSVLVGVAGGQRVHGNQGGASQHQQQSQQVIERSSKKTNEIKAPINGAMA